MPSNKSSLWDSVKFACLFAGIWYLGKYLGLHYFYLTGHEGAFAELGTGAFCKAVLAFAGLLFLLFVEALNGLRRD